MIHSKFFLARIKSTIPETSAVIPIILIKPKLKLPQGTLTFIPKNDPIIVGMAITMVIDVKSFTICDLPLIYRADNQLCWAHFPIAIQLMLVGRLLLDS